MSSILSKLQSWVLVLLVFLLPLFFLPTTPDFFDFNKMALLATGAIVLAVLWAGGQVAQGRITWNKTPLDIPVALFAIVVLISAFARTPNRMEAFVVPGTATIILACTLLFFAVTQITNHTFDKLSAGKSLITNHLIYALLASGVVVALSVLLAVGGLADSIGFLPGFMKSQTFSPVGTPLSAATFLIVVIILAVSRVAQNKKDKLLVTCYLSLVTLLLLAIVALASQIFVNKATQVKLLPLSSGWAIAVETLKQFPFGVGPGNFLTAFGVSRPLEYNQSDVWNLRFGASSNFYLQTFTETGIVGLVALLFIIWKIRRIRPIGLIGAALYSVLFLFLIVPANFILLATFYILLGLFAATRSTEMGSSAKFAAPLTFIVIAGGAIAFFVFGGRAYAAEMAYKRALDAGTKNDAQGLINNLNSAISANPTVDRYHISASQALFAIANAVARQKGLPALAGQDATEEERKAITNYIQDSIRQAQIAVSFNNRRASNWENLASIYRALVPMAKDADQFAVQAYNQAIALDPINPLLRISLGGVHFGAGRYDDAIKAFEFAVQTKPDFANAHYNLAAALREKGDFARAAAEMEAVLSIVAPGTKDYETAQKELENLKSKLPATSTGSGETLQAPQATQAPVVEPPIELPQEATPPSPSPSSSP
ncbi:tetratricopeptide repeat protein [Candidatus Microgenomates bacterium]|nr:tetratricopeptide repeat protein [Candidatus Microgenomates bacterium]